MTMDPKYAQFVDYQNSDKIDEQAIQSNSGQYPYFESGMTFDFIPSPDMSFPSEPPDPDSDNISLPFTLSPDGGSLPSSAWSPEGEASSPSEDSDSSDPVLKYISQMLMEENMEDQPFMYPDPCALNATEKSLYDVIGEQYPPPADFPRAYTGSESPDGNNLSGSGKDYGGSPNTTTSTTTSMGTSDVDDDRWISNLGEFNPLLLQNSHPHEYHFQSNFQSNSQSTVNSSHVVPSTGDGLMGSTASEMVQNMFNNSDSVLQFQRGVEEASKFLPTPSQLVIDLESNAFARRQNGNAAAAAAVAVLKQEKIEKESSNNGLKGRKNHNREDSDVEEGRSNKQSAIYVDESELSEMFDNVLLWPLGTGKGLCCDNGTETCEASDTQQADEPATRSNGGRTRARKQGKKKETVDLRTLLILCAQSISANDFRTANELLKQVRQHSSPCGDGTQRLAHFFANGLEARLVGHGTDVPSYHSQCSKMWKASEVLKAYTAHLNYCPFKKMSILFSNKMICHIAEKATTLHVVDFGVLYGFQWPILIQKLSMRAGGPPMLRITGIELPQQGFRPKERIEETGRRLAKYCDRFNVPFEYNAIAAQNWESIPIEDIKIRSGEVLAVNCLYRFKNLLDETADVSCPRDAVLNLIRKMNPDVFVHSIINGSYNAPFFVTRFREALFHFSSMFDMFDSTFPRESEARSMLEGEFYGREAMNAVACEGLERVERPETYKQWQVRTIRAGFKPLPFRRDIFNMCGEKMKAGYHKDFVIDEDGNWMLQGWKGRIIYASSCWVPA